MLVFENFFADYFEAWERLAVSGADERLVATSVASDKIGFREEL